MVILDTDVLIEFSKGNAEVFKKIKQLQVVEQVTTTVFNLEEFLFGLYKRGQKKEIEYGKQLLQRIKSYDYTQKELAGVIKLKLKLQKAGKSIGPYDECIAGICIAKNEALFTLNKRHFERVKDLKLVCINNYVFKEQDTLSHFVVFFITAKQKSEKQVPKKAINAGSYRDSE